MPLSSWDLATLPLDRQADLWLSMSVDMNPQPYLLSNESTFLYGPGGETAEKRFLRRTSAEGIDGDLIRPKVSAPVYAFHVEQEDGYIVSALCPFLKGLSGRSIDWYLLLTGFDILDILPLQLGEESCPPRYPRQP